MTDLKVSPPCAAAAAIFPCRCSNTSSGVVTLSCDGVTEAGVAERALHAEGYGANPLGAFHLRWGTVTVVAADFFGERSFEEVLLHHNRLETMEAESLGSMKEDLVTLDLNNNRLTVPPFMQLVGFNKLTSFSQSGNLLTDLADMAELTSTFPSLRNLELAGNLIGNLPAKVFQFLPEVRTIDLSFNNISYIDLDAFLGLTKVDQVLLEGNNLNHLGSAEVGRVVLYSEVGLLSLKDSKIEVLEAGFVEGLGDRSNLALSRNPMLHFHEDVFGDLLRNITVSDIPEKTGLAFYYNFIQCDCDFLWLAKDRWLNVHVYGGFCAPRSDDWKKWVSLHSVDVEELEKNCSSLNTPEPPGPLGGRGGVLGG
ncbi:oplophorus-luciferin 2-monooxygenase non-catalytic subunit isoform X2 [Penaeus vannamei]|uniref:oplophorus-luciferin 2-monooxygenase non-catalytic subunit isoform X2 n=1 Tax=Penaeus vannamei TaxID=6689 RepID=UPI00387F624F